MQIEKLKQAFLEAWSRDSSYTPEDWSKSNPSLGQCAVTALVVNDYFGGKIVWAEALQPDGKKVSHYFNDVDGEVVDLTKDQFPKGTIIPNGIQKKKNYTSTREFMLSNQNTKKRYELLSKKIEEELKKESYS